MTQIFSQALDRHLALSARRCRSEEKLAEARAAVMTDSLLNDPELAVYVAGSIGRKEFGNRSDFDPFIVSINESDCSQERELICRIDRVNKDLGCEPFSNRSYIKVYRLTELLKHTGSPQDDSENSLTVRMLLLLESTYLGNPEAYRRVRRQILLQYFRDERGKDSYRPLFLLNDVLRYWRTLCLNYEQLRHDFNRPWWKKNANLKFSRMITVFATVAALTVEDIRGMADFEPCCERTPLDRLARALDALGDKSLESQFVQLLDDYEAFLKWKESAHPSGEEGKQEFKAAITASADRFSNFLYDVLTHEKIPIVRRKYLVI